MTLNYYYTISQKHLQKSPKEKENQDPKDNQKKHQKP